AVNHLDGGDEPAGEGDAGVAAGKQVLGKVRSQRVVAKTTLQDVSPRAATDEIGRAEGRVSDNLRKRSRRKSRRARIADQHVVAGAAEDRIRAGSADDNVVTRAGIDAVVTGE